MERINGFLNVDGYFEKLKKDNNWKDVDLFIENLVIPSEYQKGHCWLNINGTKYYFKNTRNIYEEMIASECAKFLGIEAVPYDLAIFNGVEGVISESYRKKDTDYISGSTLLYNYFVDFDNREILEAMGLDLQEVEHYYNVIDVSEAMQTLEIIWQALEYRYKNEPTLVTKIMNGLIDQFMLNMLIAQEDAHPLNWEIEESIDGNKLVPYFDGGYSLDDPNFKEFPTSKLAVNFNDKDLGNYCILENFLKTSSQEFIDRFIEKFEKLDIYAFMNILKKVEEKIGRVIPSYARRRILESFSENRDRIETVIRKNRRGVM